MKFSKGIFFAVPAALAIAIGAVAATGSTEENHGDWSARKLDRMKQELKLSDDQVKSLQSVFTSDKGDRPQGGSDFRQAMTDFRKAALEGDNKTVSAKRDALLKAHGSMLDRQAEKLGKIGAILTPEQRTQFASMARPEFGRGHGGRGHHHRHGGPDAGTPDSPAAD